MRKLILLSLIALPLAGCVTNDVQRGLIGAGAGAVLADVTDNNVATGALIGGIAGTLCDDVAVCGPRF
jgi:osmotically inducible lipoprotein OsmB